MSWSLSKIEKFCAEFCKIVSQKARKLRKPSQTPRNRPITRNRQGKPRHWSGEGPAARPDRPPGRRERAARPRGKGLTFIPGRRRAVLPEGAGLLSPSRIFVRESGMQERLGDDWAGDVRLWVRLLYLHLLHAPHDHNGKIWFYLKVDMTA